DRRVVFRSKVEQLDGIRVVRGHRLVDKYRQASLDERLGEFGVECATIGIINEQHTVDYVHEFSSRLDDRVVRSEHLLKLSQSLGMVSGPNVGDAGVSDPRFVASPAVEDAGKSFGMIGVYTDHCD